jgi:hypothetical protein
VTRLDREAAILRRMVEREDFAGIHRSLERYIELLDAEKSPANLAQARDLIEWARRSLRAAHARLAGTRDRLQRLAQYRNSGAPSEGHLHIDA